MSALDPANLNSGFYTPAYGFEGALPQTGLSPVLDMMMSYGVPYFGNMLAQGSDMRFMGLQGSMQQRMTRLRQTQIHDSFMARSRVEAGIPYRDMLLGASAAFGVERTGEVDAAALQIGNILQSSENMFASMAPGFLDQLGGARGSESVFREYMFRTAQMRRDPLTGDSSLRSAESIGQMSDRLFQRMYAGDNYLNAGGLTAGQAGQATTAMQARGLLSGLSSREITDLQDAGTTDSDIQDIDVTRIEGTLRKYAKTLTAIREVFADAGRPDAPMGELISQLQAMAGQSLGAVSDPTNLARQIRANYGLAQRGGLTFDGMQQVQATAQQQAQALGLGPMSDMYLTQFSLGNRVAIQNTGILSAGLTNRTMEQVLAEQQAGLAGAATSRLAAYANIAQASIDSGEIANLDPNSELSQFLTALNDPSGKTTFGAGNKFAFQANDSDFTRMMKEAGIGEATTGARLESANEYARRDSAQGMLNARRAYRQQDREQIYYTALQGGLAGTTALAELGVAPDEGTLSSAAFDMATLIQETMRTDAYVKADKTARPRLIQDAVRASLAARGIELDDPQLSGVIRTTTDRMNTFSRRQYRGSKLEDAAANAVLNNSSESDLAVQEQIREAEMSQLMTERFGDRTPIRRLVDTLSEAGVGGLLKQDPDYVANLVTTTLGAESLPDMRAAMTAELTALVKQQEALRQDQGQMTPERLKTEQAALDAQFRRVASLSQGMGLTDTSVARQRDLLRSTLQQQAYDNQRLLNPELTDAQRATIRGDLSNRRQQALESLLTDPNAALRLGAKGLEGLQGLVSDEQRLRGLAAEDPERAKLEAKLQSGVRSLYEQTSTASQYSWMSPAAKGSLEEAATFNRGKQNFQYGSITGLMLASDTELAKLLQSGDLTAQQHGYLTEVRKEAAQVEKTRRKAADTLKPTKRLELTAERLLGRDVKADQVDGLLGGMSSRFNEPGAFRQLELAAGQVEQYREMLSSEGFEAAEKYRKRVGLASGLVQQTLNDSDKVDASTPIDRSQTFNQALEQTLKAAESKTDAVTVSIPVGELLVRPDGSAVMNATGDMTVASRTA